MFNKVTESYLTALDERLTELLRRYDQLAADNQALLVRQAELLAEREGLIEQNEQSRTRIETMVARLKGLEQSS